MEPPTAETIPLAYAVEAISDRRPGAATFLGVASIVVAVTQVVWACLILLMAIGMMASNRKAANGLAQTNATAVISRPGGLPAAQRTTLVADWTAIASLSQPRADVLDALLAEHGRDIVPTRSTVPMTLAQAKAQLTSFGRTESGEDYLTVSTGRIELDDDRASFGPANSTEVITLDFKQAAIRPGQRGFLPSAGSMAGAGANVSPARVSTVPTAGIPFLVLLVVPSLMSIALAIGGLVAGVLTLNNRRAGRKTHVWWAWLKLPFAIAGAVGTGWLSVQLVESGNASSGKPIGSAGEDAVIGMVGGLMQGVPSIIWIVAVLLIVHVRSVRGWFETRA